MPSAAIIRKIASFLLIVCIVLPLSKCESKLDPGQKKTVATDTYFYPYEIAADNAKDLGKDRTPEALIMLVALAATYLLPLATLKASARTQATAIVVGAPLALWVIGVWGFGMSRTPQSGALLAAACWICLFVISIRALWQRWRPPTTP
ncbi:MAG: hypothetical protein V4582_25095 [Pseudomonadota bacterium]